MAFLKIITIPMSTLSSTPLLKIAKPQESKGSSKFRDGTKIIAAIFLGKDSKMDPLLSKSMPELGETIPEVFYKVAEAKGITTHYLLVEE